MLKTGIGVKLAGADFVCLRVPGDGRLGTGTPPLSRHPGIDQSITEVIRQGVG